MEPSSAKIDAAWLRTAELQAVFAAFAAAGYRGRVVGGAVRNTLIGRPVMDVDLATDALPDAVMRAAEAAGLRVVPTGLQHGTVTVISGDRSFEVTTLRRDVVTDGRHAVVDFTADWVADAERRDFTINALYCDAAGVIFDPLGGLADVCARRVRFIGDAGARIREDYLRILRFFRFTADYCDGVPDAAGLAACGVHRAGLSQLSAERIRAELLRLLVAPAAAEVVDVMVDHGFLVDLLGLVVVPQRLRRIVELDRVQTLDRDAALRLGVLCVGLPEDARRLAGRLKVSAAASAVFEAVAAATQISVATSEHDVRRQLYGAGPDTVRQRVIAAWVTSGAAADDPAWARLLRMAEAYVPLHFPLQGRDVLLRGVAAGPRVGALLAAMEAHWIASDFTSSRDDLLAALDAEIARSA